MDRPRALVSTPDTPDGVCKTGKFGKPPPRNALHLGELAADHSVGCGFEALCAPGVSDVLMRGVFWVDDWQMPTNDEVTADWWMKTLFERFNGHEVSPDTFLGLQIDYDRAKGTLNVLARERVRRAGSRQAC